MQSLDECQFDLKLVRTLAQLFRTACA